MASSTILPSDRFHVRGPGVTYPPLDIPKSVTEAVWIAHSEPMKGYGMPMPIRMTVIRLGNGDLILHSPTRHTPELQALLEREGRVRHQIAPSIAHWSFGEEWQRAVPNSLLWAAPKLGDRRAVKKAGLRIDR